MTGKEAAMFGSSGTMTNRECTTVWVMLMSHAEIAIRVHMKSPPQSVLVDHRAHIHCMEGAFFCRTDTAG